MKKYEVVEILEGTEIYCEFVDGIDELECIVNYYQDSQLRNIIKLKKVRDGLWSNVNENNILLVREL